MMWWTGTGMGWGWGIAMFVGWLLFWGLIVAGIVFAVRGFGRPREPREESPGPVTILQERFAAGEIGEDEYRSRLAALHESRADAST